MSFLSFTRSEKRALVTLLVLLSVGWAVQVAARRGVTTPGYRVVATLPIPEVPVRTRAESRLSEGISPNTAPPEDLELLPGIGPALAQRIVAHRATRPPYQKPGDLLLVPGIGERLLTRITPYLRFP